VKFPNGFFSSMSSWSVRPVSGIAHSKIFAEYHRFAEVVSNGQLADEMQLGKSHGYRDRSIEENALVIVENLHQYRNPNIPRG